MKNHSVQKEINNKKNGKEKNFGEDFKQIQYKGPIYLKLRINM